MQKFLTIQILTKDCEDNILRCIRSLQPLIEFIKDIVIIDDNSTDKTLLILESLKSRYKLPIKIISHAKGNLGFAGQRNIAIDNSEGDWILILDSDETIHPNIYWELLSMIQTENIVAWFFPRLLLFPDNTKFLMDAYPDYQMRLFKKHPGIRFTRLVHEYLIYTDKEKKEYSLGISQPNTNISKKIHIYHYQLLSSKDKLEEKGERWLKLSKESKQAGFSIIGKDAFQFKLYNHRIAFLTDELKEGIINE